MTNEFPKEEGYVYVIKVMNYYKIGKTKNYEKRFGEYTMLMEEPEIVVLRYVNDYHNLEVRLHNIFECKHSRGEWYKLEPYDIEMIKNYLDLYMVHTNEEKIIKISESLCNDIFKVEIVDNGTNIPKNIRSFILDGSNLRTRLPIFPQRTISETDEAIDILMKFISNNKEKINMLQATYDLKMLEENDSTIPKTT